MATFTYRGYNGEGHKVAGSRKAAGKDQVEKLLNDKGISGYEVFESKTGWSSNSFALVPPKEMSIFSRQISVLFFSNITLMEGVLLLSEQSENKHLKQCLLEVHSLMERGYTFADAVSMYPHIFGAYLVSMVQIGEDSGTLEAIFLRMAEYFEKESMIRKKLRSAVAYPAILTVMMGAIILLLIVKILPMFNEILSSMGGEMPAITALLLGFSTFVNQYLAAIVAIVAAAVIGFNLYIRSEAGNLWWSKVKVTFPGSRYVNSRVVTSRFSRSLAILLKSGVQLLNAMEDILPILGNAYLESKFREVIAKVKGGTQLSEALGDMQIFPPLFLKMIIIGQSTGHLDDMMDRSANIFDEEVYDSIERVTVMIEPILIIVLSIIVGVILLSVMLPMISIMNAIG